MSKIFIKLRKKMILPIKWALKHRKDINETTLRSPQAVFEKLKEIEQEILDAELVNDAQKLHLAQEKLVLINWFLNK